MEKLPVNIRERRRLLRHFLATLAYRTQKAIRGAPESFYAFAAGQETKTPHQIVCHMTNVLGYGRTFFIGGQFPSRTPTNWNADVNAFHEMLEDLARHLDSENPLIDDVKEEELLQGPFADAMTHVGQLAMLRRLAGSSVPPENFIRAAIQADNLTAHQPGPVSPDQDWPEAPRKR